MASFRTLVLFYLVQIIIFSCAPQKDSNSAPNEISMELARAKAFQKNTIEEFSNADTSPLNEQELKDFQGIQFYPLSENYIFEASFIPSTEPRKIEIATSTNDTNEYSVLGKLQFNINENQYELEVYQPSPILKNYPEYLFLPFYDNTNGYSTYGGGRYLEFGLKDLSKKPIYIDFNKSYNPYCAYSPRFSCPIPPLANKMDIDIKAGVMYNNELH